MIANRMIPKPIAFKLGKQGDPGTASAYLKARTDGRQAD